MILCYRADKLVDFLHYSYDDKIGVSAEVVDNALVLRGCFDRMYSDKFCGSKAVDFLSSLQCANVVVLPSEDIEDSLVIYDQVFRRILTSKLSSEPSEDKKDKLVLVVATSTMDLDQVPNKAIAFLQNMFEELGATVSNFFLRIVKLFLFDELFPCIDRTSCPKCWKSTSSLCS